MLDRIHLLAAVTVLGVLEQGRDYRMHIPEYLLGQSTAPPLISFHFPISFLPLHWHFPAFQTVD